MEMKWDDLTTRVQARMSDGYSLQVDTTELYCTVLYGTVLYCTVLDWTGMELCTVLYYTVQNFNVM